jgi:hypothetical protein
VLVEKAQLGKRREVRHVGEIRIVIAAAQDPADMRLPKPVLARRVRILEGIRVLITLGSSCTSDAKSTGDSRR